jgi:hypothetical protein
VLKRTSWASEHSSALVCGLRIRIYRPTIDRGWAISRFSLDQPKLKKYAPEIAKPASAEDAQLRVAKGMRKLDEKAQVELEDFLDTRTSNLANLSAGNSQP